MFNFGSYLIVFIWFVLYFGPYQFHDALSLVRTIFIWFVPTFVPYHFYNAGYLVRTIISGSYHYFCFRLEVSHLCLTMSPTGDLVVWKNKGRPTKEESEILKCPIKMRNALERLKKDLNFKDGTEILLALSIASDEMVRHVNMFPEVFFMDVTANTNRQKRHLFIMVVKDANGQTFIGNATVIPSEKSWVFHQIYQKFFLCLYGEETIRRNRLALTDDDDAAHGPFDNCIETLSCYEKSTHMLCVFHAVVQTFAEQVRPLLPHKSRHVLTEDGELYGTYILGIIHCALNVHGVSHVYVLIVSHPFHFGSY